MPKLALTAALAVATALDVAQGAAAGDLTQTIAYRSGELSTPAGAHAMLRRIQATAGQLCAPSHSPLVARRARPGEAARCRTEATARAVADLRAPLVSAEYDGLENHRQLVTASR